MSNAKEMAANGAKTNWPWNDELPGRYVSAPAARRWYKRVLRRNRRRNSKVVSYE